MMLPEPWVFAVLGSLLVAVSAALSGFYTSHLERTQADIERKIRAIEDNIAFAREYFASGGQKLSFADIKLVLLQSTQPPQEVLSRHLKEIANDILRGLVDRNSAATGHHPSEHLMEAWMGVAQRAGIGDPNAFRELSDISSDLLCKWGERNNALVSDREGYKARIETTRRNILKIRFAAVALQIFGLVIVLMKDLPR